MMFVSATPSTYETEHELLRTEQIIRPTGLLDPELDVRPVKGQVDDLLGEIRKVTEKKGKVLVTTLTKRMAEDLTKYLKKSGCACGICIRILIHWSVQKLSAICVWMCLMS